VAKLADALGLGPSGVTPVEVQVLSPAPLIKETTTMSEIIGLTDQSHETYITTEEYYLDKLEVLRSNLELLYRELESREVNGFCHSVDIAFPVQLDGDDCFSPQGSLDYVGRLFLAAEGHWAYDMLTNLYGHSSVWIGPAKDDEKFFGLEPAEHRGVWVQNL